MKIKKKHAIEAYQIIIKALLWYAEFKTDPSERNFYKLVNDRVELDKISMQLFKRKFEKLDDQPYLKTQTLTLLT